MMAVFSSLMSSSSPVPNTMTINMKNPLTRYRSTILIALLFFGVPASSFQLPASTTSSCGTRRTTTTKNEDIFVSGRNPTGNNEKKSSSSAPSGAAATSKWVLHLVRDDSHSELGRFTRNTPSHRTTSTAVRPSAARALLPLLLMSSSSSASTPSSAAARDARLLLAAKSLWSSTTALKFQEAPDEHEGTMGIEDQIHEMSVFLALRLGKSLLKSFHEKQRQNQDRGDRLQPSSSSGAVMPLTIVEEAPPVSVDLATADQEETSATPPPLVVAQEEEETPKTLHRREGDRVLALGDDFSTEPKSSGAEAESVNGLTQEGQEGATVGDEKAGAVTKLETPVALGAAEARVPPVVSLEFGRPLEVVKASEPTLSPEIKLKLEQQQEVQPPSKQEVEEEQTTSNLDVPVAAAAAADGASSLVAPAIEDAPAAGHSSSSSSSFMSLDTLTFDERLEAEPSGDVPTGVTDVPTSLSSVHRAPQADETSSASHSSDASSAAGAASGDGFVMMSAPTPTEESVNVVSTSPSEDASSAASPADSTNPVAAASGSGFVLRRNNSTMDGSNSPSSLSSSSSTALSGSSLMEADVYTYEDTAASVFDDLEDDNDGNDEETRFSSLFASRSGAVDSTVLANLEAAFTASASSAGVSDHTAADGPFYDTKQETPMLEPPQMVGGGPDSLDSMVDLVQALQKKDAVTDEVNELGSAKKSWAPFDQSWKRASVSGSSLPTEEPRTEASDVGKIKGVNSALNDIPVSEASATLSSKTSTVKRTSWSPFSQSWKSPTTIAESSDEKPTPSDTQLTATRETAPHDSQRQDDVPPLAPSLESWKATLEPTASASAATRSSAPNYSGFGTKHHAVTKSDGSYLSRFQFGARTNEVVNSVSNEELIQTDNSVEPDQGTPAQLKASVDSPTSPLDEDKKLQLNGESSPTVGYQWHGDTWASNVRKPRMAKPPSPKTDNPTEPYPHVWYTIPKYPEVPNWQSFAKYSGIRWTRGNQGDSDDLRMNDLP